MPLYTSLYDNVPTDLRGLTFFSLSETGYVLRPSVTDNEGGGATMTYGTVGTVACRVDPVSGGEDVVAGRLDERTTHRITCPPQTDVSAADRFSVAGIGEFEITAVRIRTQEQVRILEATEDF